MRLNENAHKQLPTTLTENNNNMQTAKKAIQHRKKRRGRKGRKQINSPLKLHNKASMEQIKPDAWSINTGEKKKYVLKFSPLLSICNPHIFLSLRQILIFIFYFLLGCFSSRFVFSPATTMKRIEIFFLTLRSTLKRKVCWFSICLYYGISLNITDLNGSRENIKKNESCDRLFTYSDAVDSSFCRNTFFAMQTIGLIP